MSNTTSYSHRIHTSSEALDDNPCIGVCNCTYGALVCSGCGRSQEMITGWNRESFWSEFVSKNIPKELSMESKKKLWQIEQWNRPYMTRQKLSSIAMKFHLDEGLVKRAYIRWRKSYENKRPTN